MTREDWWIAAKLFVGLPLLFYVLLSVLEPQREIWRKPTKKVLITFIVAWGAVLCLVAVVFAWNALR
jgi:membrane-anchored glycerophosphoryl diester phosphodiesterase (GDPDase)